MRRSRRDVPAVRASQRSLAVREGFVARPRTMMLLLDGVLRRFAGRSHTAHRGACAGRVTPAEECALNRVTEATRLLMLAGGAAVRVKDQGLARVRANRASSEVQWRSLQAGSYMGVSAKTQPCLAG